VPESVAHGHRGARVDLRAIPSAESGLSPMELWCNEAQERYVLLIEAGALREFAAIAARERCPFAVIGEIDASGELTVRDPLFEDRPVDMPIEVLLGKPPRLTRNVRSVPPQRPRFDTARIELRDGKLIDGRGSLAGVHIDMVGTLQRLVREVRLPLETAFSMVTSVPARAAGLPPGHGHLEQGATADILLLDPDDLRIRHRIGGGMLVD